MSSCITKQLQASGNVTYRIEYRYYSMQDGAVVVARKGAGTDLLFAKKLQADIDKEIDINELNAKSLLTRHLATMETVTTRQIASIIGYRADHQGVAKIGIVSSCLSSLGFKYRQVKRAGKKSTLFFSNDIFAKNKLETLTSYLQCHCEVSLELINQMVTVSGVGCATKIPEVALLLRNSGFIKRYMGPYKNRTTVYVHLEKRQAIIEDALAPVLESGTLTSAQANMLLSDKINLCESLRDTCRDPDVAVVLKKYNFSAGRVPGAGQDAWAFHSRTKLFPKFIYEFLSDYCVKEDGARIRVTHLFRRYSEEVESTTNMTPQVFRSALLDAGIKIKHPPSTLNLYIPGYRWKTPEELAGGEIESVTATKKPTVRKKVEDYF